jgi:hypothetical protein
MARLDQSISLASTPPSLSLQANGKKGVLWRNENSPKSDFRFFMFLTFEKRIEPSKNLLCSLESFGTTSLVRR